MKDHQKRVIAEEKELHAKFDKLEAFIAGAVFKTLPQEDQNLLQEQRGFMNAYRNCLLRRIDRF